MRYVLSVEGFEGRQLEVETGGLFSSPKFLLDGEIPPKGAKRGHVLLRHDDGTEITAKFKPVLFDTLPKAIIDGKPYVLGQPLRWYEMLWTGIPLLLYFFGGILGAFTGFFGMALNRQIFRSERSRSAKYAMTSGITFSCFFLHVVVATLAQLFLRRLR